MKKKVNIKIIISILFIILSGFIGVCYAFMFERTDIVNNTFDLGKITCEVERTFDGDKTTNVFITNTSEVGAFVRSNIVVNWTSADGYSIYGDQPVNGVDYYIEINDDWLLGDDGYYYYKYNVESLDNTSVLIEEAGLVDGINPPDGYFLSVEVDSTAIQSNPSHAVESAWKVVSCNGNELVLK